MLEHVPSIEILWNRIIWSFIFTVLFIVIIRKKDALIEDIKQLIRHPKQFITITLASIFITINWFVYIWAVNHDQVLQTSLGYYINPLISVVFGVIFLKEKLSKATIVAVCIAAVGVIALTIYYAQIPYVALTLALSFASYSVLKKKVTLEATRGLAIETFVMVPLAIIAYLVPGKKSRGAFIHRGYKNDTFINVWRYFNRNPARFICKRCNKNASLFSRLYPIFIANYRLVTRYFLIQRAIYEY